MSQNWWQDFYNGNWTRFMYGVDHAQTYSEATLIRLLLKLRPGMNVLDVPCGTGRLTIALAAQGIAATGVDQSANLLARAREETNARRLHAEWVQADMRQLPWTARFDAAFCFWGSFGYFDDEGNTGALRSIAQTLRPGGCFLLDTPVMETLLPRLSSGVVRTSEGVVREHCTFNPQTARVDSEWILLRADGATMRGHTSIRLYTFRELTTLLRDCGFEQLTPFDGQGGPFRFMADRLVLVGTRAEA